ncbi:WD_REPEATS_REGION domain-containing protein [Linnemannia gamsii]|uniref:WD_REPEATS_REGION domain-containing protein n=1 Tax=Linnemannia gamsii TaxID=64522 RepID=A0A9P6URK8_9FUNG|nr:WD_REPEATS_REGION domain-containing protein [Linnemannia gamsii]
MSSPPPPSPPPTQPISTFLDSEMMGTLCKRSLSYDNQPTKARRIENTLYADYELIQAQYTYSIESVVLAHRLQRMDEYKQPVFVAPMAKPSLQAPDETLFPLMGKVKDFLKGNFQVMLILGDSGAGKSTFNRQLELELWQDYKPGDRIPLLINLPALERPERDLIAQQLRTHNFSDDQICELKQHRQFVLMCDGYDESQLHCNLHTNNFLDRYSQRDTKLIITCRPQYLGSDYRPRFVPKAVDEYNLAADDLFMEAIIAPFSEEQIKVYVGLYVSLKPRTWDMEDYMDKLKTIPNLMDLVKNPFLLRLCLEALPELVQSKFDLSRLGISRIQLYDSFVYHWLGVNKSRLLTKKLNNEETLAFNGLLDEGFENNGIKFQLGLAAAIFREQEGRPIVDYIERRDGASWKAEFFGPKHDVSLLRDAKYFYSCTICKVADSNDEFAPHFYSVVKDIGDHPLSRRNLVMEPSIIQFLAERVRLGSCSKQELRALIEQSKTDERAACAAANAITILVKSGISFNNADLRGIRVPGADLSGGHFDSANLQQTDLTGTSLTRSWIRKADFSMARMERVQFGELPFLEEEHPVISVSYSLDGQSFSVGLENGDIRFYNTTSWVWTQTLDGHCGHVTGLAYSPCGLQLVSGGDDHTVKLWNIQAGSNKFVLSGHQDGVRAVAFSPLGDQIASASKDKTVRLWHSHTGVCLFALRDHIG